MIELFKNIFSYTIEGAFTALLYMLKYVPGVREAFDEAVYREPHSLEYVPDHFKSQKNAQRGSAEQAKHDIFCT